MMTIKNVLLILVTVVFTFCTDEVLNRNELSGIVKQVNDQCPKMLDSETRIDGITIKEPNTFVYKYTLVNLDARKMDTSGFRKAMWPGILSTIKLNPAMQKLRESETIIQYAYYDKIGSPAYIFTITPADYK